MILLRGYDGNVAAVEDRAVKLLYGRTQATPQAWSFASGAAQFAEPGLSASHTPNHGAYYQGVNINPAKPAADGGAVVTPVGQTAFGVFGSYGNRPPFTDSTVDATVWVLGAGSAIQVERSVTSSNADWDAAKDLLNQGNAVLVGPDKAATRAVADPTNFGRITVVEDGAVAQLLDVTDRYVILGPTVKSGNAAAGVEKLYVILYVDGVNGAAFKDQKYSRKGSDPMPAFQGTPAREGYDFVAWSPVPGDTVTKDETFTATWADKYLDVTFDPAGGTPAPDPQKVKWGEVAKDPGAVAKEGFAFDGWFEGGANAPYDFKTPVKNALALAAKFTALFDVTYSDGLNGALFADEVHSDVRAGDATPAFGGKTERTGYDFAGWNPALAKTVTADVTYVATWNAKTVAYVVEHYKLSSTGKSAKLADTDTLSGKVDEKVTAQPKDYEGYTYEPAFSNDKFTAVESGVVLADGSLVLKLYYSPNDDKGLNFEPNAQSGEATGATPAVGGKVDEDVVVPECGFRRQGYSFVSWNDKADGTGKEYVPGSHYVLTNGDDKLYAIWSANTDTRYVVNAYYQADGKYEAAPEAHELTGTTDADVTVDPKTYARDGYALDEARGNVLSGKVAGDGTLVLSVYYKRQFTVIYAVGDHAGEGFVSVTTTNLDYGAATPAAPNVIAADGWQFYAWNPTPAAKVTDDATYTAVYNRTPAEPIEVSAAWVDGNLKLVAPALEANRMYRVLKTSTMPYLDQQLARSDGWVDVDASTLIVTGFKPGDTGVLADCTVSGALAKKAGSFLVPELPKFTVTFDADGGAPKPEDQSVEWGGKAVKPASDPSKAGYDFVAWYVSGVPYDFDQPVRGNLNVVAEYRAQTLPPVVGISLSWKADGTKVVVKLPAPDAGDEIRYKDSPDVAPVYDDDVSSWAVIADGAEIDAAPGARIGFVECVSDGAKARKYYEMEVPAKRAFTVSFSLGRGAGTPPDSQSVTLGDKAKRPDDPTSAGLTFVEWQLDGKAYDFDASVSADLTLVAKWDDAPMSPLDGVSLDWDGASVKLTVTSSSVPDPTTDPDVTSAREALSAAKAAANSSAANLASVQALSDRLAKRLDELKKELDDAKEEGDADKIALAQKNYDAVVKSNESAKTWLDSAKQEKSDADAKVKTAQDALDAAVEAAKAKGTEYRWAKVDALPVSNADVTTWLVVKSGDVLPVAAGDKVAVVAAVASGDKAVARMGALVTVAPRPADTLNATLSWNGQTLVVSTDPAIPDDQMLRYKKDGKLPAYDERVVTADGWATVDGTSNAVNGVNAGDSVTIVACMKSGANTRSAAVMSVPVRP